MPPKIAQTSSALYRAKGDIDDRNVGGVARPDPDRLPVQIAVPIVLALNLSLWLGIGLVVRALL